ncbi:MAG TPA: hydrogenase [Chryseosolibacter sp.]
MTTPLIQSRRLIFLGLVLFLLGLILGLFVPSFANPRMALSGHLEGILNGLFLCVLGIIWQRLALGPKWHAFAFWLAVYGAFANYLAVIVAAVTGQGRMMPIAGGKDGTFMIEGLISFLLVSLSVAMLLVCGIVLTGFYRYMRLSSDDASKA